MQLVKYLASSLAVCLLAAAAPTEPGAGSQAHPFIQNVVHLKPGKFEALSNWQSAETDPSIHDLVTVVVSGGTMENRQSQRTWTIAGTGRTGTADDLWYLEDMVVKMESMAKFKDETDDYKDFVVRVVYPRRKERENRSVQQAIANVKKTLEKLVSADEVIMEGYDGQGAVVIEAGAHQVKVVS